MGKGSAPRKQRDDKAYADNWERIFVAKRKTTQPSLNEDNTPALDATDLKTRNENETQDQEAAP